MNAITVKMTRIVSPKMPVRRRSSSRNERDALLERRPTTPRDPATTAVVDAVGGLPGCPALVATLGDAHPRVEVRVEDVRQQVGNDHRGRGEQEDALEHRVVLVVDR